MSCLVGWRKRGVAMADVLLKVTDLAKHFPVTSGMFFSKEIARVKAVDGVNFAIKRGETFGLVGESGCGKTTTAKLILLLQSITRGDIEFEGRLVNQLAGSALKDYRSSVQVVFQDPRGSLSPRMRVGDIIAEPMVTGKSLSSKAIQKRVEEVLELVGLRRDMAKLYPHEFSGGQRQRIAIARAVSQTPKLILLDEPVSALDVSIGSQIMNLLQDIQEQLGVAYMLIAHSLAVVKHMSHRIGVMYLGKLVEMADSEELYRNPLHPYTRALFSAALPSSPEKLRDEIILTGEVPSPLNPPTGCSFHPRCFQAKDICRTQSPVLKDVGGGHLFACLD